jgi:hypothetical protein
MAGRADIQTRADRSRKRVMGMVIVVGSVSEIERTTC